MVSIAAWTTRLLSLAALGLSAWLWWLGSQTELAVGCDFTAFDCEAALASPWAKWLGVPVGAGGVACYLAASLGSMLAGRAGAIGAVGWRLLEASAPLAIGAAIWFVGVQLTQLESFCLWCLLTHACGVLAMAAGIAWRLLSESKSETPIAVGLSTVDAAIATNASTAGPPALGLATLVGLVGVAALVGGQLFAGPEMVVTSEPELDQPLAFRQPLEEPKLPVAEEEPVQEKESSAPKRTIARRKYNGSREIKLLKGNLTIDAYDHAVIGSPEAPHIVVEMMDYACPRCREFHETLTEAVDRFGGQVAVIVMPVPGEKVCNKYVAKARPESAGACYAAKLAVAVSQLEPNHFERFHKWMLQGERIPSRTSALIEAYRHVDEEDLSNLLADPKDRLTRQVRDYIELARAVSKKSKFGLPAQIIGDKFIAGKPKSIDDLCLAWTVAFGVEPIEEPIPF